MGSIENSNAPVGPDTFRELETGAVNNHLLVRKFKYPFKGVLRISRDNEDKMSSTSEPPPPAGGKEKKEQSQTKQSLKSPAAAASGSAAASSSSEPPFPQPDQHSPSDRSAYLIRWNRFEEQVCNAFSELFCSDQFVDVTLACEGEMLKAHKIVLAMSSPFFRRIFQETPCKHPVVIIKGMTSKTLRSILQYVYLGEVVLNKNEINNFMDAADYLSICGVLSNLYSCDISTTTIKEMHDEQEEDSKFSEMAAASESEDVELLPDNGKTSDKEEGAIRVSAPSPVIKYHGVKSRWSRRYSNTSYHGTPTTSSSVVEEHKRSASAGEVESISQSNEGLADVERERAIRPASEKAIETPRDVEMGVGEEDSDRSDERPVILEDPERHGRAIQRAYPKHYGSVYEEGSGSHSEDWKPQSLAQYPPVFSSTAVSSVPGRSFRSPPYSIGAKDFSHPLQVSVEPHQSCYTATSSTSVLDPTSTKAKFHSGFTLYTPAHSTHSLPSQRSSYRTQSESEFPPTSSPSSLASSHLREDRMTKHRQLSSGSSTSPTAYHRHSEYLRPQISLLSAQGMPFQETHRPRHPFVEERHREMRYRSEERELGSYGHGGPKDFLSQPSFRFGSSMAGKPHTFPSATDLSVPGSQQFSFGFMQQLKSPSSSATGVAQMSSTRPKTKAIRSSQVPQSARYTAAEVDMMVDAVANYPGNIVPCTLCQKFVKRERLRAHIHECHLLTGEKIICPHCGIALKSKGSFRVHIWRHKRGALPTRSTMTDFDRDRPPSPATGPASH